MNHLYYGDNLVVLRESIASESIDLVYLDPPFNSQANYNVIFHDPSGLRSGAQILAFEDTWTWGIESEQALATLLTSHGQVALFLDHLVNFLGRNSLSAYLTMMSVRLVELYRVLKSTGSLYLHCDPSASHYLKMLLDFIFGVKNFRTEIIWQRTSAHGNVSRSFGDVTDTIFYYSKSSKFTWNQLYKPYKSEHIERNFAKVDADGRRYTTSDLRNPVPRPNLPQYPTVSMTPSGRASTAQ